MVSQGPRWYLETFLSYPICPYTYLPYLPTYPIYPYTYLPIYHLYPFTLSNCAARQARHRALVIFHCMVVFPPAHMCLAAEVGVRASDK